MKVFYLIINKKNQLLQKEIGIFEWDVFLSGQNIIENMARVKMIASTNYAVYLLVY